MQLPTHDHLAAPDTPLGQLQRGRGAGWLRAIQDPAQGRTNLLACLARDPRWDRQVESRGDYYATLALELEVTPAQIVALGPPDDQPLRSETLKAMFDRGCKDAAGFADLDPPGSWRPLPEDHSVARPLPPPVDAPIEILLASPAMGRPHKAVAHRLRATRDPHEIEALRAAADDPTAPGFRLAMTILGQRGDSCAVPRIAAFLATNPVGVGRAASLRYLLSLPPTTTVPLAREWLGLPDARGDAAEMILREHAEPEDIARVRAHLAAATHYYTICDMVDALARVPELGPYPELEVIYSEASYSYARMRAARAMARTDPAFPATFAEECLWDSAEGTREVGCRFAEASPQVRKRLHDIACDPIGDTETREAAAGRLACLTAP